MTNAAQLKEVRDSLRSALNIINDILKEGPSEPSGSPPNQKAASSPTSPKKPKKTKRRLPVDIDDPNWPAALPSGVIVNNNPKKWVRANTIFTKFETFKGPVLDFGCGEGHTTITLHDQNLESVGYDREANESWAKISSSDGIFTDDWEAVKEKGPYESVLLHDVLDHIEGEEIEDALKKIASVMTDNGRVYVMAHPFSSRHGGHLYYHENKAYLHLLLDDDDIAENFPGTPFNQQIVKPQGQYQKYITDQFTIVNKKVIPQAIEPWVCTNLLPAIKDRWFETLDISKVEKILQIGGIYYTLEKLSDPV